MFNFTVKNKYFIDVVMLYNMQNIHQFTTSCLYCYETIHSKIGIALHDALGASHKLTSIITTQHAHKPRQIGIRTHTQLHAYLQRGLKHSHSYR